MTLCELITNPITRMVEEGKNLDEIAEAVCPKIKNGREKIIRVIKDFLGEEYLIKHAEVLGYDVGKAQLARKRKHRAHEKIDAGADTVVESNNVTPTSSCTKTVKAVNTEQVKEAGQTKGDQALVVSDVHDKPAVCCQDREIKKVVRKNIVSEKRDSEEKMKEEKKDDSPIIIVSDILVNALRELIRLFSIKAVHAALVLVESDI